MNSATRMKICQALEWGGGTKESGEDEGEEEEEVGAKCGMEDNQRERSLKEIYIESTFNFLWHCFTCKHVTGTYGNLTLALKTGPDTLFVHFNATMAEI